MSLEYSLVAEIEYACRAPFLHDDMDTIATSVRLQNIKISALFIGTKNEMAEDLYDVSMEVS